MENSKRYFYRSNNTDRGNNNLIILLYHFRIIVETWTWPAPPLYSIYYDVSPSPLSIKTICLGVLCQSLKSKPSLKAASR